MSTLDAIEWDDTRVRSQGAADTREEPTWYKFNWDATKASAEQAYWDTPGRAQDTRNSDILTAAAALTELNGQSMRRYQIIPVGEPGGVPIVNEAQFWRDLAELRRTRPDALGDFAKDKADYDARLTQRFQRGTAQRAQRMAQGGLLGNLAGGIAGAFTDPLNVATLPFGGGGRSAATRIITEGLFNAGVEVAESPLLAMERKQQGGELSFEEGAWNVALAGLGGAGLTAAHIGIGKGVAKALEAVPTDVKAAIALRATTPDYALTPDQAAALAVIDRHFEVDVTNPFAGTYEGLEAHARRIDDTIAAMGRWPEAQAVQALRPAVRPTSAQSAPLRTDFDSMWAAIIGNEGGTNRDGSFRTSPAGAIGPAQVMPGTAPEAARLAGLPWDEAKYRSDHAYNVALGQAYYRDLLRQFDGDPVKAAAAYNAGPGSTRKGTGLRGAMERARRAGVPDEWVSFLPAETRKYVADFRRRTSIGAGDTIDMPDLDLDVPTARAPELDAERPLVDGPDDIDLPELRRDLFANDDDHARAQAIVDGEAFGVQVAGVDRTRTVPLPEGETRGGGIQYHGARGDIPDLSEGYYNPDNIYGGFDTFYTTDAVDIAGGYQRKRQSGRIYQAEEITPVSTFDMEDRLAPEDVAAIFGIDDWRGADDFPASAIEAAIGADGKLNLREAMDEVRLQSSGEGFSKDDVQDIFSSVVWNLQNRGYGAMRHVGGLKTDRAPHNVKIYFAAHDQLRLTRADPAEVIAPVAREEPAPAVRDELEAVQAAGPVVPDVEAGRVFDEPGSDAIGRTADLAWHDAQMMVATRADDGLTFDLGDGKGERSFADIEAELKADEDAISTIEGCLAPAPLGAAA